MKNKNTEGNFKVKNVSLILFLTLVFGCSQQLNNEKIEVKKDDLKTFQTKSNQTLPNQETWVRALAEEFVPCGESSASKKQGRVKSTKPCSVSEKNNNIYTNTFVGILEGQSFWNKRKDYVNFKTNNAYKGLVDNIVNSMEGYRNRNFNPNSELPIGKIVDLTDVYHLLSGNRNSGIKNVVLHRTGSSTANSVINQFTPNRNASVHYLIDKNGTINLLIAENKLAYHVLDSEVTKNKSGVSNANSIGIEVVGESNTTALTEAQKRSVAFLTLYLAKRYGLKRASFSPHEYIQQKSANEGAFYYNIVLDTLKKWNNDSSPACKKIT